MNEPITRGGFFLLLLVLGFGPPQAAAQTDPSSEAEPALLTAIKRCLSERTGSAQCLNLLFREFLTKQTAGEALTLIQRYQERDPELRLSCHPVVHAVGRELFQRTQSIHDTFSACNQTCQSGCYHGAVERFLWGETGTAPAHVTRATLQKKVAEACTPTVALRFRYQCLHGLGHAILYFGAYQLPAALEICDQLPDLWSRRSCYGGVFMENITAAAPEKRFVSATDYHYPCNQVAPQYRSECYVMQTSRMIEMGLSLSGLFEECARAASYRNDCVQSIGRDLANEARTQPPRAAAAKCELAPGGDRQGCIRGLLYALIDNTWDGTYAFPFCAALGDPSDASYCFRLGTHYLNETFELSPAQITNECRRSLADPLACLAHVPQ